MGKKIAAAVFLVLLMQTALASEARALLGPNWNRYLFSSEVSSLQRQQKLGFVFGVGWAAAFNLKTRLEVNALFSQRGAKTSLEFLPGKTISGFYRNTSLALPCLFKYKWKQGASPYAALGPELVFILSHHLFIPGDEEDFNLSEQTRKIVFSFNFLLGYEWPIGDWGLFAELRYNHWLSDFWTVPAASAKSETVAILFGGVYYL